MSEEIIIFVHRFSKKRFGGVERVIFEVTKRFKNIRWKVLTWNIYNERKKENLEHIEVYRIPYTTNEILNLKFLRKALEKTIINDTKYIWTHDIIPTCRCLLVEYISKSVNKPIISTFHGIGSLIYRFSDPLKYHLSEINESFIFLFSKTIKFSVVSKSLRDFYIQKTKRKIFYTPNGIDYKRISRFYTTKKREYFVFLGSFVKNKGIYELLKAIKNTGYKLYLGLLNPEKVPPTLPSNVINLGYLNDKKKYEILSKAKALVLPSYVEGFGLVVLESLAVGTPVIVTPVGVAKEIFESEHPGVLLSSVPPDVRELSHALRKISQIEYNPNDLKRIAKNYDWKNVIKYWKVFLR